MIAAIAGALGLAVYKQGHVGKATAGTPPAGTVGQPMGLLMALTYAA